MNWHEIPRVCVKRLGLPCSCEECKTRRFHRWFVLPCLILFSAALTWAVAGMLTIWINRFYP